MAAVTQVAEQVDSGVVIQHTVVVAALTTLGQALPTPQAYKQVTDLLH